MKWEELIVGPQLIGILFMLAGCIQLKYPPKKINALYGYRTQLSMKNQENWDEANYFSSKLIIRIGLWLTIAGVVIFALFQLIEDDEIRMAINVPCLMLACVTSVIILHNKTERHLESFEKKML